MRAIRRSYLYLMTAVGLVTLAVGLDRVVEIALDRLGAALGPGALVGGTAETYRSDLSLGLALVAVGAPLWAIHWWFAQRGATAPTPAGEAERSAALRAFYLALAEFVAGTTTLASATAALTTALGAALGQSGSGLSGAVAIALVAGPAAAYHRWVRAGDERVGEIRGAAAWWPRLSRLALTFIAGLIVALGTSGLLDTGGRIALGSPGMISEPDWWVGPFANGISMLGVGTVALAGLLWLDGSLVAAVDWRASAERDAALRRVYGIGAVLTGALAMLLGAASGLAEAIRLALGVSETTEPGRLVELIGGPPLTMLPIAVWALWVGVRLGAEEERWRGPDGRASANRMRGYAVALAGLLFTGLGCGWLVGLAIDAALGGQRTVGGDPTFWRRELGWYAAFALIGLVAWSPAWLVAVRRRAQAPAVEAASMARRVALYLALGGALVSGLGGLVLIVYRLFQVILGVPAPANLVSYLSTPIGAVIAASAVVAYHGVVLRTDLRQVGVPGPAEAPAPAAAPSSLPLVLVGPPGADLAAVLPALGEHLPPGYDLRVALTRLAGGASNSGKDDPG